MSIAASGEVHVLAGVIFDDAGRVLLAQRPSGKDLAGLWEFPGGKIEPGETRRGALARELREELGIEIGYARPLTRVRHAYPHRTVLLDFWIVRGFTGAPRGLDGQTLQWCDVSDLPRVALLPADRPMLRLLGLPEEITSPSGPGYVVVSTTCARDTFRISGVLSGDAVEAEHAAREGADFIVLTHSLPRAELKRLCFDLDVPVFAHGFSLCEAWELGATGVSSLSG